MKYQPSFAEIGVGRKGPGHIAWLGAVLSLVFAVLVSVPQNLQAAAPEEEYVNVISVIQDADSLQQAGKTAAALTKYREAYKLLQDLKAENPAWNPQVVAFRLNYLAERFVTLNRQLRTASTSTAAGGGSNVTDTASAKTISSAAPDVEVKLLEAGAEPRKALRLQPKPGQKQTCTVSSGTTMDMKVGAMDSQAVQMPPTEISIDITVTAVSPEGDISYEAVVNGARVLESSSAMPQLVEATKATLAGLKGVTGKGVMSSRGFSKGADFTMPANADPQLRQGVLQLKEMFGSMSACFPEEPVGASAKWEVRRPILTQGMKLDTTGVYELESSEDERVAAKSTVSLSASNQKFDNPSMPGMKMDLTKMQGKGTGNVKWNLGQLIPVEATSDTQAEFALSADMGGQKQAMTLKLSSKTGLQSK